MDADIDTHARMKTTVEIPEALLDEARRVATQERTTVRALIEEGLRRVVADRSRPTTYRLRRAAFKGDGLQPAAEGASWEQTGGLIYEGRGGGLPLGRRLLAVSPGG